MRHICWFVFIGFILAISGCMTPPERGSTLRRLPSPWTTLKQSLPGGTQPSDQASSRP